MGRAKSLAELLNAYFTAMRSIIERHGGTVEKFIGDAVVGVFGVPITHEDDALQGRYAQGWRCSVALEAMNDDRPAAATASDWPPVSVSILAPLRLSATAPGPIADGNGARTCDQHGRTARAGCTGGRGASSASERTSSQPASIDAEFARRSRCQGIQHTYCRLARYRNRRRQALRLGGGGAVRRARRRSLPPLNRPSIQPANEPACVVVTVVAPPGMGKSRLAAEATRRLAQHAQILIGRCVPYGEGVTYAPLIEMAGSLQMPSSATKRSHAPGSPSPTPHSHHPRKRPGSSSGCWKRSPNDWPVVAVVDDLHWAEALLIDVLDYVATLSVDRPILLLCLSRPDLFDTRPEWAAPRQHSLDDPP